MQTQVFVTILGGRSRNYQISISSKEIIISLKIAKLNTVGLRESIFDLRPRVLLIEWWYFQQFGSSQGIVAKQIGSSGLLLDFKSLRLYSPKYLVFGKAVKVRHYPVTVSTEN